MTVCENMLLSDITKLLTQVRGNVTTQKKMKVMKTSKLISA